MVRARKTIKTKKDFQGSVMRFGAMLGFSLGSLLAAMQADARDAFGPDTALFVYPVAVILGPLAGYFIGGFFEKGVSNLFSSAFFGSGGGSTGPQHSQGDTLLQQAEYEQAAEWFAGKYRSDPEDWRAQARLVEILGSHFDDEERLVGEKNRLLKAEKVPEGLWCRTAFEVAAYREATDRPKEAILIYRMLLERYPEDRDAGLARERLQALGFDKALMP